MSAAITRTGASFSDCRTWRYSLFREWEREGQRAVFIGLNPSTADESQDDPTIRRCIGFARSWGCGSLHMLNLFAFRATDPRDMKRAFDPVGPHNDAVIRTVAARDAIVVAAWGAHGTYMARDEAVREMLYDAGILLYHLGLTKDGHPRHPLYLRADAPLVALPAPASSQTSPALGGGE